MSTYDFDKMTRIGDFEVHLATKDLYGCFEDVVDGGEGGLWFELSDSGQLVLIDYDGYYDCLLYTSPSPRDRQKSRMPSSA